MASREALQRSLPNAAFPIASGEHCTWSTGPREGIYERAFTAMANGMPEGEGYDPQRTRVARLSQRNRRSTMRIQRGTRRTRARTVYGEKSVRRGRLARRSRYSRSGESRIEHPDLLEDVRDSGEASLLERRERVRRSMRFTFSVCPALKACGTMRHDGARDLVAATPISGRHPAAAGRELDESVARASGTEARDA